MLIHKQLSSLILKQRITITLINQLVLEKYHYMLQNVMKDAYNVQVMMFVQYVLDLLVKIVLDYQVVYVNVLVNILIN